MCKLASLDPFESKNSLKYKVSQVNFNANVQLATIYEMDLQREECLKCL